jgi:molybdenum cofactor cytidylyltransferase
MARIAAVVLAAGASLRYGDDNKLLAKIESRTLVARAVEAMLAGGAQEIIVVTGHQPESIEAALGELHVTFAHNAGWQAGMGSSIAAGVSALGPHMEGTFIVPGDMPFVDPAMIRIIIAAFEGAATPPIVYPATATGAQRNPVLWPRRFFAELISLATADGAKSLVQRHASECIAVPIEAETTFADIDTPADLDAAPAAIRSKA